jgi:hypothetical protein
MRPSKNTSKLKELSGPININSITNKSLRVVIKGIKSSLEEKNIQCKKVIAFKERCLLI